MFELALMTALLAKHFALDFFWQPPWMLNDKGRFGAWGGIAHSGVHALATATILIAFWHLANGPMLFPLEAYRADVSLIALVVLGEFVIHYFTDFAKMNLNAKMGWGPTTHSEFWQLTGFDQLVHQLTYVGVVWIMFGIGGPR